MISNQQHQRDQYFIIQ